jgi:hypothetical protein
LPIGSDSAGWHRTRLAAAFVALLPFSDFAGAMALEMTLGANVF